MACGTCGSTKKKVAKPTTNSTAKKTVVVTSLPVNKIKVR